MSPDAYVCHDKSRRLLCGFSGQNRLEDPCFIWTYSTFEDFLDECITPSMYHFMANYVAKHITKDDLWDIQCDDYAAGSLEAAAVDAYYDTPINERILLHEQELVNLRADLRRAKERESAAIDAMLEENKPFDHTSLIDQEYCDFMRGIIDKAQRDIERLECEIHEEMNWQGGHEVGAEDDLGDGPRYDHMDEI
jgi:hypothetical protein